MHDQILLEAAVEPREQVERELTGIVVGLIGEVKSLAAVARAQQRRIDRLEAAVGNKEVRS